LNTYYQNDAVHEYTIVGTYNHDKTDYAPSDVQFTVNSTAAHGIKPLYLEPITNEVPHIDGQDDDLGALSAPLVKAYNVTDTEGDAITVVEKLVGNIIRTNAGGAQTLDLTSEWASLSIGKHTVTIEASDDYDPTRVSTRTWTFTKILADTDQMPE